MKIYKAIMLLTLVASNITFAQISTNLTGVNSGINGLTQISGESAADVSGSDAVVIDGFDIIMAIENSSFYGGEGGSATAVVGVGNSVNANGGIGIRVNSNEKKKARINTGFYKKYSSEILSTNFTTCSK